MPRGRAPTNRHGGRAGGRGGGYRGARGSSSSTQQPRGLFEGGIWKCDCTPRLTAEHFKVKKPTTNQGRWFYTCQKGEDERCGFFLWDEDARVRMEAAVLGNSRSEPRVQDGGMVRGQGMFAGSREEEQGVRGVPREEDDTTTGSPSPSPSPLPRPAPSSSTNAPLAPTGKKRTAYDACLDQENGSAEEPWSLTGQEELELAHAANIQFPQTPQKAQKTGVYATPNTGTSSARKLPWVHEPITPPSTRVKNPNTLATYFTSSPPPKLVFPQPEPVSDVPVKSESLVTTSFSGAAAATAPPLAPPPAKAPLGAALPTAGASPPSPPAATTPLAVALPIAAAPPPAAPSSPFQPPNDSLTNDVNSALAPLQLSNATLSIVRGILARYERKTLGMMKGRDAAREALKKAEARVVELEAKITQLAEEKVYDRGWIDALQSQVRRD